MNTQTNTGGPAFARPASVDTMYGNMAVPAQEGATLLDLFAIGAMQALMASEPWVRTMNHHAATEDVQFKKALAKHSWSMAAEMLAARPIGGA